MSYPSQGYPNEHAKVLLRRERDDDIIFPSSIERFVILTAGAEANQFGEWVEIVDDEANTLSAIFASQIGILSRFLIEDYSARTDPYLLEIAYCEAKIILVRIRLRGALEGLFCNMLTQWIPVGSQVFYRLACKTALATLELSFRYFYEE